MLTLTEAAHLAGVSQLVLGEWVKEGRAIGLEWPPGEWHLPAWQFEAPIWNVLESLGVALGVKEGWALLTFLETPHGGLDGVAPKEALLRGVSVDRIQLIAESDG